MFSLNKNTKFPRFNKVLKIHFKRFQIDIFLEHDFKKSIQRQKKICIKAMNNL